MKISDPVSSRILTIAVSISLVLCSISLLLFSISRVSAENPAAPTAMTSSANPWDANLKGAVGLGTVNNTGYFVIWGTSSNMLYKVDLTKARNWYDD